MVHPCKLLIGLLLVVSACTTTDPGGPRLIAEETLPPASVTPLVLPTVNATASPTPVPGNATALPNESARLVTPTPPNSPTVTLTATPTITRTPRPTRTITPSLTPSPTQTLTPTITDTPSITPPVTDTLVSVTTCAFAWFFAPPPDECPLTEAVESNARFQTMERGTLIGLDSGSIIFVLFADGQWLSFPDTYVPGETLNNQNPPSGLLQPQGGFGKLWLNDISLQQRLGWAIAPEVTYTTRIQSDLFATTRYLAGPNGQILILSSTSWSVNQGNKDD